jgi:hypothetical protein
MYFPTTEHYFEDFVGSHDNCENTIEKNENIENIDENNDCLICLEINTKSGETCIKLHNLFYIKSCSCDGWIHGFCLEFWYNNNKKCPICLSSMYKKNLQQIVITPNINIREDSSLRDNVLLGVKTTFLVIFLYNFIFILSKIIETCSNKKNND